MRPNLYHASPARAIPSAKLGRWKTGPGASVVPSLPLHELSIALGIVDLACEHINRFERARLAAVHLRLGLLSGVVREALVFSFDAASAGTSAEGARLQIEDVPVTVWCPACLEERPLRHISRRECPQCGAIAAEVIRGADMEVVALEIIET